MEDIQQNIMRIVISLEMSEGHLKWKASDIARRANVSRPLIYYHFGRTKSNILLNCFSMAAEEFYGLSKERMQIIQEKGIGESLVMTFRLFKENPTFAQFYQKWRTTPSALQQKQLEFEDRYQKKLSLLFAKCSPTQIKALHALFHGLVTSPFLDEDSLRAAVDLLNLESLK